MNKIKDAIKFHIDTGSNKSILEKSIVKEGFSQEDFNKAFDEMIIDNTITYGVKCDYVVITEWMPNAAKKLLAEQNYIQSDKLKLSWERSKNGDYYNHSSDLGTATVEEINPGKWRWEAYSSNEIQSMELDCWWGIAKTIEEGQLDAEKELERWKK